MTIFLKATPEESGKIDLHTHSRISDGTDSPAELIHRAKNENIGVIALTDHDTSSGWEPAQNAAKKYGVTFVPGMELSTCTPHGRSLHILSYLHDPNNAELQEKLQEQRDIRRRRAYSIVRKLSYDYPLSWDDVLAIAKMPATTTETSLGRPHIADALAAQGIVSSREEAFKTLLSSTSQYYTPLSVLTPEEGIRLIVNAGGVPILAHGLAQKRGCRPTVSELESWISAGLAGFEVHHREHGEQDRATLLRIARKHDLIVTGSSDFHGKGKPNCLGEYFTTAENLNRIEAFSSGSKIFRPE